MIIGLDFDNTIACYDHAIARFARELFALPADIPPTKLGLRNYLRAAGREPEWTAFQGYLYGPGMDYAEPFPGAVEAIAALQAAGHKTFIISHRSMHPYAGPKHDLHAWAKGWMTGHLRNGGHSLFSETNIYLNEHLADKIAMIGKLKCGLFLDDLPEVLGHADFPAGTKKLLFSSKAPPAGSDMVQIKDWNEIQWHCAG